LNRHAQTEFIWDEIRNEDCTSCELHKSAQSVCLLGDGPVPCDAMVIGEAPGFREDNVQVPFSGRSGILLRTTLKEIGLDPRKIYITNVVACRPPGNRTPTRKEVRTCSELYLKRQIDLVKPSVILLLGATAISWALGKKSAVGPLEGTTFLLPGTLVTCVPSRHPSAVLRAEADDSYPFHLKTFKENLLLFKRTLYPVKDEFKFSQSWTGEIDGGLPVYIDIETTGLNPFKEGSHLWSAGWANKKDRVWCMAIDKSHELNMRTILKVYPIMAHRSTFEGTWLLWHYGVTPKIYYDTKIAAHLMDENSPTGLKYQAIRHLGVDPWDEGMDFQNPDFKKLLPYNARDVQYGLRLYREIQLPFIKRNPKIGRLLRYILLPAQEVLTEMICNGFHINIKEAKKKLKHAQLEKKKLNDQLNEIAGKEVNPGSPKQMSNLFYRKLQLSCPVKTPKGKDSTSEAALIRLRGKHPATDLLWDWRGWDKKESTYLEPWIRQGPVLHAIYDPTGTDTGRLSSSMVKNKRKEKGNGSVIHQCPRDGFIRNLVSPRGYVPVYGDPDTIKEYEAHPEEWCMVAGDLSQVELRLVAHAARDLVMIDIFHRDRHTPEGDIHLATAMDVIQAEAEKIDKETRKKAKAVNFGFIYGMWANKFQAYALEKFDLTLSKKDAREYRQRFFEKYSQLLPWHRRVEAFVTAKGYIDSIFGRRRHLPHARHDSGVEDWIRNEAVRMAINSPIQGAASDLLLFILALIASYSLKWDFKIDRKRVLVVGSAHDSGLFECHRSYRKELKEGILWTVANLPLKKWFDIEMLVPIFMDVNIYSNQWEGKELTA
jgi:uracil-DNA glycosylase family 4